MTPSNSTSVVTKRPQAWIGTQNRRTSLKAAGTSDGSFRTRSNWSGWAAKRATMFPIAAIVVSTPAPRYWWMMCPAVPAGMSPRASASKMPRPTEPGARSSAVTPEHQPYSSPAMGKFSIVRWFIGPMTCIAAWPHRSMLSRTCPVKPIRSATTSSGNARARASMASNEPRDTSSSTSAAALASICVFRPRRARGDRFAVNVARSRAWTGGSEASDVPCRASLTIGLKPIDREEKVSGSPSAVRMMSYRVSA